MDIRFVAKCPYCKAKSNHLLEMKHTRQFRIVVYCDPEDGGCNKPFVVEVELAPTVKTWALVEAAE